ncbi:MAG TPA: hypothetical protein VNT20_10570 [Flavisolibacter sp.]|nr:hypothetical protein [Flavisolibacter sp.]
MNFSKFLEDYWTSDGRIKSFHLDVGNNRAEIGLLIKRVIYGKGH